MISKSTKIKLRRDTVNNYASHPNFVPLAGEVCIVDPTHTSTWSTSKKIRFKIGNGTTNYSELPYVDEVNKNFLVGYVYEDKFYFDSQHTQEETILDASTLYLDLHEGIIYYVDIELTLGGEPVTTLKPVKINFPTASDAKPGVVKLYQTLGSNTDGTISQRAITDAFSAIKFKVIGDEDDTLDLANTALEYIN